MSQEPQVEPETPVDPLAQAITERETSRKNGKDSARKPEHPTPSKAPSDTPPEEQATPASEITTTEADTTATAAPATEPSDLSFLPDAVRSKLPTLAPEVKAHLKELAAYEKRYKDLQAETTPLRQGNAEDKKLAARWRELEKTPKAAKAAMRELEAEQTGKPVEDPDDGWKFSEHSDDENKAYLDSRITRAVESKVPLEDLQEFRREREQQKVALEIGGVLADYADKNGIPEKRMTDAISGAKVIAANLGVKWTTENAIRLVELGLGRLPEQPSANTRTVRSEAPGLARVASPSTRGVGSPAPKIPSWQRDGLKWPKSNDDRVELFNSLDVGNVPTE